MKLKNWYPIADPYEAPELGFRLHGNIYESSSFSDGDEISTSKFKSSSLDGEIITCTTFSGSIYLLDLNDIDLEYLAVYPDAKERIIKSINKRNQNV